MTGPDVDAHWRDSALCAQTDPEAFFPEKGGSPKEAKQVCADCEVRAQCLAYALDGDERFGVWGGLSTRERDSIRRGQPVRPLTGAQTRREERDELILAMASRGTDAPTIAEEAQVSDRTVHRVIARRRSQDQSVSA